MEDKKRIYQKLETFIRKFYTNELIRGGLLFIGLGLLYFLFILFVEYFLWLKPLGRTILFGVFLSVEIYLLFRFILFPMFKLFKLQKGISYEAASIIIGNHFTEVSDKLVNFLQLSEDDNQSELLLASIDQKANSLKPIPFGNAINFKTNRKYLPLALIPVLFLTFFFLSGNSDIISQSLNRVVHFNSSFIPPAPFQFVVLNADLQTEQNKDFVIRVKSKGKIRPEKIMIFIENESYFMEAKTSGEFQFRIEKPYKDIVFHLEANSISSKDYELKVVQVPLIADFEMRLKFPSYLKRKAENIVGTGNAIIPEGTLVEWKISTLATENVGWSDLKNHFPFSKNENTFTFSKNIFQNTEYQILSSNRKVKNHEKLNYTIHVVIDRFPTINVNSAPDSLNIDKNYLLGHISDDYGLSKLQVVYYERDKPQTVKRGAIPIMEAVFGQFIFAFPGKLPVEQGISYEYYFEVFDNDALHHFKSTKSSLFSNRVATEEEKEDQILQQQNDNINNMENSLKNQDKQISEIEKLQNLTKEKDKLEFKDQKKVIEFLMRQAQQDQMMKDFSEKMKDNLDKLKTNQKDELKENLQKRLESANKDLEKNKKLLDELKALNDKIKNENLLEKLDKFKQNSKNQTKNLEQLVELTKKYYVQKKAEQIAEKLDQLSDKQEKLASNEKENKLENQKEINSAFDKIEKELKELQQENEALRSPLEIPKDVAKENEIKDDLNKSQEALQNDNKDKANLSQKKASKNMKELSKRMKQSMQTSQTEQLEEDIKMLRQILDNLLAFSMSQEEVMGQFKNLKTGSPAFNKHIKTQQNLKEQFRHIDDSLFAMSLRNPKITEQVTTEIGNVYYNIDKTLESLTASQVSKGLSYQQYAISSANTLADFLSDMLNNMQMDLSGKGAGKPKPGKGKGMQLPDIIKKQEGIGDKMKKALKEGNIPGEEEEGNDSNGGAEGRQGGEEGDAKAVMEIYKEQKQLREALQNELNRLGLGGNSQNALEQMKQIEKQLLNKGFKTETLQKIMNVKQELLKLQTALQQQGEDSSRQSSTNKKKFENQSGTLPPALLEYLNSIEILNRQSLPLRSNFNQKVQEYFNIK